MRNILLKYWFYAKIDLGLIKPKSGGGIMYLNTVVKIPEVHGKIAKERHGKITYIKFEYDRIYNPEKRFTYPKRVTIGKLLESDSTMMVPNESFLKYFPEIDLPSLSSRVERSSSLGIGTYIVIQKIIRDYKLKELLALYFSERDLGLFLDLATYSIITEKNVGQYYPDYAYNHPLFSPNMKVYSDSTVSDFLQTITPDQSTGFLNGWNEQRNFRERIYISYDSTNKNCQAGDLEMVEFGHPKIDIGAPIFNYAMGYDIKNREPLFYEKYPGSIVDVSQLKLMLAKATGYGYKKIGFILDRGYFSKKNIEYMDECGYSFVLMIKGMASLVEEIVSEKLGSFEKKRVHDMESYGLYGTTVKRKLFPTDAKERYFHIYHNNFKEADELEKLNSKIRTMKNYLMEHRNEEITFGPVYHKYFELHYDEVSKKFVYPEERISVTEYEMSLCGYFVLVTSEKMTAKDAIHLYKSRDVSEKMFGADKTFLGNKCLRVHSDTSAYAKIFIEFVALIIRNKIYTSLSDEMKKNDKKSNFMTVPAAIRELEKIEMTRQTDNIYRLDHAVTATQKKILNAFELNENHVKYRANEISSKLQMLKMEGK